MNDQFGIGLDDLPRIHREQFVHYLTVARPTDDTTDWPTLRPAVLDALAATFGLDDEEVRQGGVAKILDATRRDYDPAAGWSAFMEAVWAKRQVLRPDITWPLVYAAAAIEGDSTERMAT